MKKESLYNLAVAINCKTSVRQGFENRYLSHLKYLRDLTQSGFQNREVQFNYTYGELDEIRVCVAESGNYNICCSLNDLKFFLIVKKEENC